MRLVLDTNIYISHLLAPNSAPDLVVQHAFRNHEVLMSAALLAELERTLSRDKFDVYVSRADRRKFLHKLYKNTKPTAIIQHISICRDPNDNAVLELAVNGEAEIIISGDKDLLVLHPFKGISILKSADFLSHQKLS